MKLIYVCSPYSSDDEEKVKENVEKAKKHTHFAIRKNVVPIAPHLFYPLILTEKERELALTLDLEILKRCDELWAFGGLYSKGMITEINFAKDNGIKVRHFNKYYQEV